MKRLLLIPLVLFLGCEKYQRISNTERFNKKTGETEILTEDGIWIEMSKIYSNNNKQIDTLSQIKSLDITELDKRLSAQKGIRVEFQSITDANHFFSKTENSLTKNLDKYIKKETALY